LLGLNKVRLTIKPQCTIKKGAQISAGILLNMPQYL